MEGAAIVAGGDLALSLARLRARDIFGDGDERVEPRLERLDAREAGLDKGRRRDLSRADKVGGRLERQPQQALGPDAHRALAALLRARGP